MYNEGYHSILLALVLTVLFVDKVYSTASSTKYNRNVVINQLREFPCNLNTGPETLYDGTTYLIQNGIDAISSLSIGGWIMPRGYSEDYYTIYSFHETGSITPTIYSVSYQPISLMIAHSLLSTQSISVSAIPFYNQKWIFVLSYISFSSTTFLRGGTTIWKDGIIIFDDYIQNISDHQSGFFKSKLLINIGYSNPAYSQLNPSCSYCKFISIFSEKVNSADVNTWQYDPQAMDTYLFMHLDGLYTNKNPGKIFSLTPSENGEDIRLWNLFPLKFSGSNKFDSSNIISGENLGFVLQFSIKIAHDPPNDCYLLQIGEGEADLQVASKKLKINNPKTGLFQQSSSELLLNQWRQIVVIVKQGILSNVILTVDGAFVGLVTIPYLRTPKIHFGLDTNVESIEFNSIRIYSGIYISDAPNCDQQMHSYGQSQCLTCNDGYLINFQAGYTCESQTCGATPPLCPVEKEWSISRVECVDAGKIHDRTSGQCRCRKQYYEDFTSGIGKCLPCKRYCDGCDGAAGNCKSHDIRRDLMTGECGSNTFDDGFNCKSINQLISDSKSVKSQDVIENNFITQYSISYVNSIINETFLEFPSGGPRNSFLFSFSYQQLISPYSYSAIATVTFDANEVITLLVYPSTPFLVFIILKINNNQKLVNQIQSDSATWFVIWTNLATTSLRVYSNGFLGISETFSESISYPFQNLSICIGSCESIANDSMNPLSAGKITNTPVRFIANAQNPSLVNGNDPEEILNLLLDNSVVLALFKMPIQQKIFFIGALTFDSIISSKLKLEFTSDYYKADEVQKGFGIFHGSAYSKIRISDGGFIGVDLKFPISVSLSVWITYLYSQTSLVAFAYTNNIFVEYMLIPFEQQRNAGIRICIGLECKDTQNSRLNIGEGNFLAIYSMDRSRFSVDVLRLSFRVICNYASETLSFVIARPRKYVIIMNDIFIGAQLIDSPKSYEMYVNQIRLIQGNSYFHENYVSTSSDHCYVSVGFYPNVLCIQPSKDYVKLEDGSMVSRQSCVNDGDTIRIVNLNTLECIDSKQKKVACYDIDQQILQCILCQDGYFFPVGSVECQPCSQSCKTCSDTSTNCLSCNHLTYQVPPSCECVEKMMFFDEGTLQCGKCSNNCETCSGLNSNCITCAENRVNPPDCICNASAMYFENMNGQCQKFYCDQKCDTCSIGFASNCLTCAVNRNIPPECSCISIAHLNMNGECEICEPGSYFNASQLACQECEFQCAECQNFATNCLSCNSGLVFDASANTCGCDKDQVLVGQGNDGTFLCATQMDIELEIKIKNQINFTLEFTFPFNLKPIDFSQLEIIKVLEVSLQDVSGDMFSLDNPRVDESVNRFSIDIIPKSNFKSSKGYVIFLQVSMFVSMDGSQIMNQKYLKQPFLIEEIGPLFFSEPQQDVLNINNAISDFKNQNAQLFSFIQNIQLVFYFFNFLQPTVVFLLVNVKFPPNLYMFLKPIGLTVFPDVFDYQAVSTQKINSYQFFNFDDGTGQVEMNQNKEYLFKRLGVSNSLLITIPLICCKYILILTLLLLTKVGEQYNKLKKHCSTANEFLKKQLVSDVEVNLLLSFISILVNLSNLNSDSWVNRYGFCLCFLVVAVNLYVIGLYLGELRNQTAIEQEQTNAKEENNEQNTSDQAVDLTQNTSKTFILSRIKGKRLAESKSYFFLQFLNNILILGVIFLFRDFEEVACVVVAICFGASIILTLQMKPYLKLRSRYVKLLTDFIFAICWTMMYFIATIEYSLLQKDSKEIEEAHPYIRLGFILVVLLIVANLLYLLEQISCIVDQVGEYLEVRRIKKREKNTENQLKIEWIEDQKFPQIGQREIRHETKKMKE